MVERSEPPIKKEDVNVIEELYTKINQIKIHI